MVLVYVEAATDEFSQQAIAFAGGLGEEVHAVIIDPEAETGAASVGVYAVSTVHVADDSRLSGGYAPAAWGRSIVTLVGQLRPTAVIAPGTDRGNEVLAHAAAQLDQPLSANTAALTRGTPVRVTRVRWGGSVLEEAELIGSPLLLTVAPHAVAAGGNGGQASVRHFDPQLSDADLAIRVSERLDARGTGVSLADAGVVVSGGRGVGSAEAFAVIEELAELLGGAVGCSRAVTMAGWRSHLDQVGQTGTKISPEIYIACGISGATQHMAGCKGAKRLLAINADAEASIFSSADYAVIGDLHEIVPAISAEIRKVKNG